MSLTISRGNYTSISSSISPPPCTLEIKFSTQKSKDTSNRHQLIIGGIQRVNSKYDEYKIAWGIMIRNYSGGKYIEAKINDTFGMCSILYNGYDQGGKVIDDGEPHTIRLCINTNSSATIYEDGKKLTIRGRWDVKSHIDDHNITDLGIYLGGHWRLPDNYINAPTTFYYVKFANKCITDSHINKSDCSAYWTWNSDGYSVLNGVPDGRVYGVYDDITLDYIRHSTYKHSLDLYGIKK